MSKAHEMVCAIGRLVIEESLAGRGASRPKVKFDDPVIEERVEKLLDEWIASSLGAK